MHNLPQAPFVMGNVQCASDSSQGTLAELRDKCRQFEVRLMSHADFVVLQDLWAELCIPGLILFDGTYPNARTTAGAKEGSGH